MRGRNEPRKARVSKPPPQGQQIIHKRRRIQPIITVEKGNFFFLLLI